MEFRVLGPLQVEVGNERHEIGGPRLRALLAALLIRAGEAVPVGELTAALWNDAAPGNPRAALQTYVTRLRGLLRRAGSSARIESSPAGYRIAVPPDGVDVAVFRGLVDRADALAGPEKVAVLRQALSLWRGTPLAGIESDHLQEGVVAELEEMRLLATQRCLEAELVLHRDAEVVTELRALTASHPMRERFWWLLMTALHRGGRRDEALAAFRTVSRVLATELGVEPGAELRDLHTAIVHGDPLEPDPAATDRPTPAQLPPDGPGFTGRDPELDLLSRVLTGGGIAVVSGLGGIGKTWLALRWAHRHRGDFPDGQLFVNLHGFDVAGRTVTPETALRGFLDALGVPAPAIPATVAAQAALFRSLVGDRRMLIVLDNARDTEHVTDLLSGSPHSAVIVTSRDRMVGLVAQFGARPVPLDVLGPRDAERVLLRRLGGRLADEAESVRTVVSACGGLPLALGIAAARASVLRRPSLAAVAADLRDVATRLNALDEDPHASLRAVLSWSYGVLGPEHARLFVLVGAAPGPHIGTAAAAATAGLTPAETGAALRVLERQSLVTRDADDRWLTCTTWSGCTRRRSRRNPPTATRGGPRCAASSTSRCTPAAPRTGGCTRTVRRSRRSVPRLCRRRSAGTRTTLTAGWPPSGRA